ncbi:MAG: hypothetical protein ACTSVI_16395 [Promethearchaeota archaeon]
MNSSNPTYNEDTNIMMNFITNKLEYFFESVKMASSYKPILFKAILHALFVEYQDNLALMVTNPNIHLKCLPPSIPKSLIKKAVNLNSQTTIHLILIDKIAMYFIKNYFILSRVSSLKHLNSKTNKTGIIRIIEQHFPPKHYKNSLKTEDINTDVINKTKNVLFKTVLFILRKDTQLYQFVTKDEEIIDLPYDIFDQVTFNKLLDAQCVKKEDIKYIAVHEITRKALHNTYFMLKAALDGLLFSFLNKINTTSSLMEKIQLSEDGL